MIFQEHRLAKYTERAFSIVWDPDNPPQNFWCALREKVGFEVRAYLRTHGLKLQEDLVLDLCQNILEEIIRIDLNRYDPNVGTLRQFIKKRIMWRTIDFIRTQCRLQRLKTKLCKNRSLRQVSTPEQLLLDHEHIRIGMRTVHRECRASRTCMNTQTFVERYVIGLPIKDLGRRHGLNASNISRRSRKMASHLKTCIEAEFV